ncbi:restriction endonuclease [Sphaerochaeta globosa]|uniref:Restriction endonuclease type IV Mrr domain-containing protein n=1 Tax=Sphaerochaeta globosa (strain ATCC BAA-1886 / DSM 22777 / Buddy) TaxID=158189 RepID=F0RRG0_SPHGB|nr:restriction endonuclease [Sphaerochaeta globosa]ADY14212.1 hypothetical protein SpiBuddy_2398 [Sphaerochaeta globosa str. Buddy]
MALPYEIRKQIIQCIGTCFHYKDNVEAFLMSCELNRKVASRHKDEKKFVWARLLMDDLDNDPNGEIYQRRILTELCKMRKLPDNDAPNPSAGLDALRRLKELAFENGIIVEENKTNAKIRKQIAQEKNKIAEERSAELVKLKQTVYSAFANQDRQGAGYALEDVLMRLFALEGIEYRKPYKLETQQIDGHFKYEGFDYLVEAKWENDPPNEQKIGGFERKVNTKLDSTRGMFFSMNGFRREVVQTFEGKKGNIILFSGEDLMHILEGRISLREAIQIKIEKAAQEGKPYTPITSILS